MWNELETFSYALDEDKTFEAYYRRYEDINITDCADWTDAKKVRLLLRKLGTVEHNKFVDYILPKKKKHPELATAVENYIGPSTVPIVQKNVKTAMNLDIRAHSVETEK